MTVAEAAEMLSISITTVYKLIRAGKILTFTTRRTGLEAGAGFFADLTGRSGT